MEREPGFDERVISLILEAVPARCRPARITTPMRLQGELALDSIAIVSIMFRFEEAFGVDLSHAAASKIGTIRTVGDVIEAAWDLVIRTRADGVVGPAGGR